MTREEIETKARAEALKRYSDEIAATLGGVRHGFIEGAMWVAAQATKPKQTIN